MMDNLHAFELSFLNGVFFSHKHGMECEGLGREPIGRMCNLLIIFV